MPIIKCKLCRSPLEKKALLSFKNMPRGAQAFPDASSLNEDRGTHLSVTQCIACGLIQLLDEPVPYYREVIRAAAFSPEMGVFRRTQFCSFLKDNSLVGKKIIEIGCGRGEYLELMKEAGADAYGLEYQKQAVDFCKAKGLKVSQGFVDNPDFPLVNAPYEAFMMLNFLEHLPRPVDILKGIANNLTGNAVGLVEVPNYDFIARNQLFAEFISDHLLYFTRETFVMILSISGFEVLSCKSIWHDYILSAVIRKRTKLDTNSFLNQQKKLQIVLNDFINGFPVKSVAVWGAGHQALAIISLTNIAEKIRYVVDSAPFKQGKYTPATHLPIVSPEKLESDPVNSIIVMAASYSDEVANIIRQKYSRNIQIAILRENRLEIV